jgi:hypothetical protein
MMRRLLAVAALAVAAGCGEITPERLEDPIQVSGKVTLASGHPARNAVLYLQPVGPGQQAHFVLGADGSFKGSVTPGEYTYYVAPQRDTGPVPERFRSGSMDRTVTIKSGDSSLNLRLE